MAKQRSFNHVIWSREPKSVYIGFNTLSMGVYAGVITFNEDCAGRVRVLQQLGLDAEVKTMRIFKEID